MLPVQSVRHFPAACDSRVPLGCCLSGGRHARTPHAPVAALATARASPAVPGAALWPGTVHRSSMMLLPRSCLDAERSTYGGYMWRPRAAAVIGKTTSVAGAVTPWQITLMVARCNSRKIASLARQTIWAVRDITGTMGTSLVALFAVLAPLRMEQRVACLGAINIGIVDHRGEISTQGNAGRGCWRRHHHLVARICTTHRYHNAQM